MPPKQAKQPGDKNARQKRYLVASPLIVIVLLAVIGMDPLTLMKHINPLLEQNQLSWAGPSARIKGEITHIKPLDFWLNTNTVIFAPTLMGWDPLSQMQARQLSIDLAVLYAIFLIEGVRRFNVATFAGKPNVIAMASQLFTIGVVGPVYFFFHYVFCAPVENFNAAEARLTDLRYTKTVLPAVLLGYYVPFVMMSGASKTPDRQVGWMMIWQFYPVLGAIVQFLMVKLVTSDKVLDINPFRDATKTTRNAIGVLGLISALSWLNVIWRTPFEFAHLFIPHAAPTSNLPEWMNSFARSAVPDNMAHAMVPEWMLAIRKVFQVDQIAPFGAALLWLGLMYGDMLRAGMIKSLGALLTIFVAGAAAAVITGPGAAVALGWWYRETLLAEAKPMVAGVKKTN